MNYFAHAVRHLDQPAFLAGLALPDWLSVVDRQVRIRAKRIHAHVETLETVQREMAQGALQHLDDDQWFHATPGFFHVTGQIGNAFREVLGGDEGWQCGFLGHIVCELLIDSVLTERVPEDLERYYLAAAAWEPQRIQDLVNQVCERQTARLVDFIPLFVQERFLFDYQENLTLLRRLNQVMRRVQLPTLPAACVMALQRGRELVRAHLLDLLPTEHFPIITRYS